MDAEAATLIRLRGVRKHWGAVHAVDGVDLDIRPGEVFGLIGHNGAGKSTLFKMMLGLVVPSAGTITIDGQAVDGPLAREVRRRIGYLPENLALWDNLSGRETLRFFARLKQADPAGCDALLERVGLAAAAAARPVREYSKGMRQRLGFAQALLGTPRVLFLDEPTSGLDPHAIREFWDQLGALRAAGVTLVLSSHVLAELQHRVDRLAVMAAGRVQALGSLDELRAHQSLPLSVRLRIPPAHRAEALALLAAGGHAVDTPQAQAEGLRLRCRPEAKVALLQSLAPLGARLLDVQVDEPSLEDLFFARPEAAGRAADDRGAR